MPAAITNGDTLYWCNREKDAVIIPKKKPTIGKKAQDWPNVLLLYALFIGIIVKKAKDAVKAFIVFLTISLRLVIVYIFSRSAKVDISESIFAEASIIVIAKTAPEPSPKRMPKSNKGFNSRNSSDFLWPISTEACEAKI